MKINVTLTITLLFAMLGITIASGKIIRNIPKSLLSIIRNESNPGRKKIMDNTVEANIKNSDTYFKKFVDENPALVYEAIAKVGPLKHAVLDSTYEKVVNNPNSTPQKGVAYTVTKMNANFAGTWSFPDDTTFVANPGWGNVQADFWLNNNTTMTKYKIDLDGQCIGSAWGYAVMFNVQETVPGSANDLSGFSFQIDPGRAGINSAHKPSFYLTRFQHSRVNDWSQFREYPIGEIYFDQAFPNGFDPTEPHHVSIEANNSHYIIKIDNKTIFDFTNTTYTSGKAGLRAWNGTSKFYNMQVTEL